MPIALLTMTVLALRIPQTQPPPPPAFLTPSTLPDVLVSFWAVIALVLVVGIPMSSHMSVVLGTWLTAHGVEMARMRIRRTAMAKEFQMTAEEIAGDNAQHTPAPAPAQANMPAQVLEESH